MHKLARQVRFCINPFSDKTEVGYNSFSAKPTGEGLGIYLALRIELKAEVNQQTGFVVNIVEIDKAVRQLVVPIFEESIKRHYYNRREVGIAELGRLLKVSETVLTEYFTEKTISDMQLSLNPNRQLGIKNDQEKEMLYFAEKFDFAAMHKLWNEDFSDDKNYQRFGKCANPNGHGHNYSAEITVCIDKEKRYFKIADYQKAIKDNFIELVDHKNLNMDVEFFNDKNPTVENIAVFAWDRLEGKFSSSKLEKITIWETDRTCCSYSKP